MKIAIKLKENQKIHQPMAKKPWKNGFMVAVTRAADNRPYAVIETEHNEFEFVPLYAIKST